MASAQEIVTAGKLGERIQKLMEKEKLTQADLANDIGIARQTLAKYIKGERQPKADVLQSIADRFNMSVDELTGRDSKQFDDKKAFLLACSEYTGLSIEAIEKLHAWNVTEIWRQSKEWISTLSAMIEDDHESRMGIGKINEQPTLLISSLHDIITYKLDVVDAWKRSVDPKTGFGVMDHIESFDEDELWIGDGYGMKKVDAKMFKEFLWQDLRDRVKAFAEKSQKGNNDGKH